MVLQVSGLSKKYGSLNALSDFNLEVKQGEVWGVLGPNGSGKTTALGILLGVTLPTSGTYEWFDKPPSAALRRRIGSLLEQPNFYPWFSAIRNLQIVAHLRGTVSLEEIENKLKLVGLWERRHEAYSKYSLGMKQRLAMASALIGEPEVLVLDEPTNGLDAQAIAEVRETILAVSRSGKTILMASHILDEVEKICSHVLILQKGKAIAKGTISEVLAAENTFEFAADDMEALRKVLEQFSGCRNLRIVGQHYVADFDEKFTSAQLNKFMFDHGIYLNHLARQSHGLESQFLKLLGDNRD
ncbi:MAG: ABC transporter ATP-binding protein [Bdellovibrionales bacterium]|nr:ABC transporter ATP-binding protein [Bdellovibrionales bacterium]